MADAASELVTLSAEAPVLTEVTVIDGHFQFVGRGSSPLELQLPPGLYVVQFKLGATMREVPVTLRPGSPRVVVEAPVLDLSSPAPLGGSETATHYKAVASARSVSVDRVVGKGAQLFLFARAARPDRERPDLESLFDIVIGDKTGAPIARFADVAHRGLDGRCAGLNLEVDPGAYLVRYGAGDIGYLEQTVVVSEGWQTQVFTSSRTYPKADADVLGANFPNAAVFIAPIGRGFQPDSPAFASAESARQALGEDMALVPEKRVREVSRDIRQMAEGIPDAQLRQMARDKFDNPILALYAAHLMLLRPVRDWEFLSEVVANLRRLLGNHPDVMAFGVFPEINLGTGDFVHTVPPMLRSSWKLLVSGSTTRPGVIPCESYAGVVADRMWGKSTWQIWRAPSSADRAQHPTDVGTPESLKNAIATLQQYALSNIRSLGARKFTATIMADRTFSNTERLLLLHLVSTIQIDKQADRSIESEGGLLSWLAGLVKAQLDRFGWADFITGSGTISAEVQRELSPEKIARSANVPFGAISASLTALAKKVNQRPPS